MIYTPRCVVDMLLHPLARSTKNKAVCTKIDFKGFEISIAMDSSHGDGDLFRSDIRVFADGGTKDVSSTFFEDSETMLYGNAETLLRIMNKMNETNRAERTIVCNPE